MMKDTPYPGDPNAPPPVGFNYAGAPPPPPAGFHLAGAPPPPLPVHVGATYSAQAGHSYPAGVPYSQPPGYPTEYPPPYTSPGFSTTGSPYVETEGNAFSNNSQGKFDDVPLGWQSFSDKAIRRVFIRKVYAILMIQLAFTTAVIALFIFESRVKRMVQRYYGMYLAAYVIFLVLYFVLVCCESVRRKWPTNLVVLSMFTMALSYMVGTISSFHDTQIVLMAMGICAACCLAVTLFSFNTKYDLTSCGGVLFILCFVLFLFGLLAIFTYNRILSTVYAACGALLFMLFLAYDTQMLMGGKKHELSSEEHIFAALQLYLDVVYIFLFILSLMGRKN